MTDRDTTGGPRRRGVAITLLSILLVLAALLRLWLPPASQPGKSREESFPKATYEFAIFGTFGRLTIWAPEDVASRTFREVAAYALKLHNTINLFDPESELARLNASAYKTPFACGDELWRVLRESRRAFAETDGAFDVSIGPLMRLWGIHRKRSSRPTEEEVARAREAVGLNKVVFDDRAHSVRFTHPDSYLDFGGIAKGYALNRAVELITACGGSMFLLDLGGNIYCSSTAPPGRTAFTIGIRDPMENESLLGRLRLTGMAVATSGNYERQVEIEGKQIPHIIDPRSGQPVSSFASVTVITPSMTDSDIYSTAAFVGGIPLIEALRKHSPESSVIVVKKTPDGQPETTIYGDIELQP